MTQAERAQQTNDENDARVFTCINRADRAGLPASTAQVAERTGLTRNTVERSLARLKAAARVSCVIEGRKAVWSVVKIGAET